MAQPENASPGLKQYVGSRLASNVGSGVQLAIAPLVAALLFDASPKQIGLLTATTIVVNILLRLPAASVIDRSLDERRIMVLWGIVQAVVSGGVMLVWWAGGLTYLVFLILTGLGAACASIVGAAGFRMINHMTQPGERTGAIGLLNSARSAGDIVGQSGGGFLVGLMPPPLVYIASSLSYLISVALLPKVKPQLPPERVPDQVSEAPAPPKARIASIIGGVLRKPFFVFATLVGIAGGVVEPALVLFLLRVVELHPSSVGIAIGLGAVGGILGGLLVGKTIQRFGFAISVTAASLLMAAGTLVLVLAGPLPGLGFASAVLFELLTACGGTIVIAGAMGRLQEEVEPALIARTMSAAAILMEVTGLIGIGIGVAFAEARSLAAAFYVSLGVYVLAIIVYLLLGRDRD